MTDQNSYVSETLNSLRGRQRQAWLRGERLLVESLASAAPTPLQENELHELIVAEMVKGKPWKPETLEQVGGTQGIGVNFLEETFASVHADPRFRRHGVATRGILRALLPDLDGELRLITPIDPEGTPIGEPDASASGSLSSGTNANNPPVNASGSPGSHAATSNVSSRP